MKEVQTRDVIKMYILKAIKKLNFNNAIYEVVKKMIRKGKILSTNNIKEERDKLNRISEKPKSSSCVYNEIEEKKEDLLIIVPCYNVEKYVAECLNSILEQKTEYSYKVKIIDDGSTDKTSEIIDSYSKYPQLEIIHQENKGFSGARNTGLSKIDASFVMFVDSDDRLAKGAIQSLLKRAYETGADIVDGGIIYFDKKRIKDRKVDKDLNNVDPYNNIKGFTCGKIIKAELFKNISFPDGFWYEDSIMAYLLFPLVKSAAVVGEVVYCYRKNTSGISLSSRRKLKAIDTYWILEQMLEDQKTLGIKKSQEIYELVLGQICLNFRRTYCLGKEIRQSIFILSVNLLKNEFPDYTTKKPEFADLEKALRTNNYSLYNCFCSLKYKISFK